LFTIVIVAGYSYSSHYFVDESRLHFHNDLGIVEITGMMKRDPDVRDQNTRLTISARELKLDSVERNVSGDVLVYVPRYPEYRYGDVLRVSGELKTPPQFDDFDYREYLSHQGIYSVMYYPDIKVLDRGQGFVPMAWIHSFRGRLAETLEEVLPEPQASLAQGVILGIRGNITQDLRDDFARSGTAHLLAISGLHLGIMAGILLSIGLFIFGRKHYLYVWLALGAVWLYVIITGMNPPVVRGAIMASLFLAAELLGRQRSAFIALVFAAAVMVGVHPYILGDASFQLSFLAMAGLVFIFPVLRDFGRRMIASKLGEEGTIVSLANIIVDTMSATLAAVIAVWPVVAYYFGTVSLVGPLATFLALPALPIIIIAGGLAAVLGLGVTVIGQIIGWVAWPFLSYMILVISGLAVPSVSSVEIGSIQPSFIWGYYAILAAFIWFHGRRQRIRNLTSGTAGRMRSGINLTFGFKWSLKWVLLPLLLLAVLVSYTAATFPDNTLRVSFLDVGEGDAILIQKGTRQVLVDGGPSPGAINLALSARMPFWDRTIEMVVLTHPHHDHLSGLVEVLRRYEVEQVVYSEIEYDSSLYDEWWRVIDEKGIANTHLNAGHRIDLGEGVIVEVLNPLASRLTGTESDIDNNSLVLRFEAGDVSFLLAADIMKEEEWQLIRERADLAATVLKAGHHGSDTSTTLEFLSVVNPQAAVICCGAGNKFEHPNDEVVERLKEMVGDDNVFCTADHGTIDFITDGERLWVEVEKN